MLRYGDQPTPPFNSPYQQHSQSTSRLESPYPSPRHDTRQKYTEGLGLYEFHSGLPSGLPPSPQPSESWNGHMSNGVSPLMNETIADPWTSGAYDHPVSRSPLPWTSAHTSPRSSTSPCTREMSVFSHDGSEQAFRGVKVEYPGWAAASEMRWGAADPSDMHALSSSRMPSLTVAPERLNADVYSYDHQYGAPQVPKLESNMYDYDQGGFDRASSEQSNGSLRCKSRPDYSSSSVPKTRARNRRHTDPANAAYRCDLCITKGFARRYNYKQHMLIHDPERMKIACPVEGCARVFVRKTDLARHDTSVHQKIKPFVCSRCAHAFARKDTLRRYVMRNIVLITPALIKDLDMRKTDATNGIKSVSLRRRCLRSIDTTDTGQPQNCRWSS
jgi:hypothetical protein